MTQYIRPCLISVPIDINIIITDLFTIYTEQSPLV